MKHAILLLTDLSGIETVEKTENFATAVRELRKAKKSGKYLHGTALEAAEWFGKLPKPVKATKPESAMLDAPIIETEAPIEIDLSNLEVSAQNEFEDVLNAGDEPDAEVADEEKDPFDDGDETPEVSAEFHPPRGRGRPRSNG